MTERPWISMAFVGLLSVMPFTASASEAVWGLVDPGNVANAVANTPEVVLAELELARLRLEADSATQLLTGSVRTGVSASYDVRSDNGEWSLDFDTVTLSTRWNVVPYGPSFEAAQRAASAVIEAEAALRALRTATAIAFVEASDALQRSWWTYQLAASRVALQHELVAVAHHQVGAGVAAPAALLDAENALTSALDEAQTAYERWQSAADDITWRFGVTSSAAMPQAPTALEQLPALITAIAPLPAFEPVETARLAAAENDARVRATAAALPADEPNRATSLRLDDVTLALSARAYASGELGRASASASWDTRTYQPSLDVTLGPWSPSPNQSGLTLSASVTLPFGNGANDAAADILAAQLATERYEQAVAAALRAFDLAHLSDVQAQRSLQLALDRYAQSERRYASLLIAVEAGSVSAIELERVRLDRLEQSVAVARAASSAVAARTALELRSGIAPSTPRIATAIAAVTQEVP